MTTTRRDVIVCCPECSTTEEIDAMVGPRDMRELGFELIDGAWIGLCPGCYADQVSASNAEYEALVRAAAQIGRVHNVSPLTSIGIPTGEGFDRAGEKRFGFWAVSGDMSDQGFEMFRRFAGSIVANLNHDRGVALVLNVNGNNTLAIVHGIVD